MTDTNKRALDNFNYADSQNLRMDDLGEKTKQTIRQALAQGVPDGWVLVPKEPTGAQIMAGIHCLERNDDLPDIGYGPKAVRIYKSMNGAYHK
jgi:hypothetical protein